MAEFKKTAIILGAGPTGLSTAWQLAKRGFAVILIEKEKEVGGQSSTQTIKGYNIDKGPHKLYPQVPCAEPMIRHFLKDDVLEISKKSQIYVQGRYMNYPFGLGDLFKTLGLSAGIKCGISFLIGKIKSFFRKQDKTYVDFIQRYFGAYAYNLVFRPVAEKLWGDPNALHVQLAINRVMSPNIIELIKGVFWGFRGKPKLSAEVFYYPRRGMRQLWEAMKKEIETMGGKIFTEAEPTRIFKEGADFFSINLVQKGKELVLRGDILVSTIPIQKACQLFNPPPKKEVMEAVAALKLSSLYILYLIVDTPRLLPVNWIFFPATDYYFSRISEQKGFSGEMAPREKTALMVEIPLARDTISKKMQDENKLCEEVIEQLRKIGLLKNEHKILDSFSIYSSAIYPIYGLNYQESLDKVLAYSDTIQNFYLNGRLGLFCYNNMDHSMEMGTKLANHIADGKPLEEWQSARRMFYKYKIVD